ncbi:MAG: hypothetical protein O7F08_09190 [Deltaproteobacteria bacterium]|nr:hypothetical protein [Deltaproteobacteria bacterium]
MGEFGHDPYASQLSEATILGCILRDRRLIVPARFALTSEHFTLGSHRVIWQAMARLDDEGVAVDEVLICANLDDTQDLSEKERPQTLLDYCGGAARISELSMQITSPSLQFESSMTVLRERLARRALKSALETSMMDLASGSGTETVVAGLNRHIDRLKDLGRLDDDSANASSIAREVMKDLEEGRAQLKRCPTGNKAIDKVLGGGIAPGLHYIVGAVSGHGKTTLTSAIVAGLLRNNQDLYVDWYGVEVPRKWQFCRIASSWGNIPESFWHQENQQQEIKDVYRRAIKAIGWGIELDSRLRIYHCRGGIKAEEVALKTALRRRALGDRKLIIVVDYLQRSSAGTSDKKMDRIALASEMIAGLPDENTATIALTQFTTDPAATEPIPMPKPGEARWAKDVRDDACDFLVYHRPLLESLEPLAVLQLAKSRYGRLAHVWLLGTPSNRFESWDSAGSDMVRDLENLYNIALEDLSLPDVKGLSTARLRV